MVIVPPYTARWNAYIDYYDVPLFKSLDDVYSKRPRQTVQNFYNQCKSFFDSQPCEKHGIVRRATNSIVYGAILKTRHSNRSVLVIYTSTAVYIIPRDLEHANELRHSLEKEGGAFI